MATYNYKDLFEKYESFCNTIFFVYVGDKDVVNTKKSIYQIDDIYVNLSCEYKANIATFTIVGAFDEGDMSFGVEDAKKYILLGSSVKIEMGYGTTAREVFRGYIARVAFNYDKDANRSPGIVVTAMDVKGIMMVNCYSKRLTAKYYSDAVQEIFNSQTYQTLISNQIVTSYNVTATPDKPQADAAGGTGAVPAAPGAAGAPGAAPTDLPTDRIEMAAESDYDFIVRAAKRFNYEFFTLGAYVYFRKAKENAEVLLEIDPSCAIFSYNIEYDLTGLVGTVEVRGIDAGKGSVITAKKKNSNKLSLGSKAKALVSKQTKVYFDPSADTKESAEQRATSLMENISYRLASLDIEIAGLPEIIPGSYITLIGIGSAISNTYYITETTHYIDHEGTYLTRIIGKAATMADVASTMPSNGGMGSMGVPDKMPF